MDPASARSWPASDSAGISLASSPSSTASTPNGGKGAPSITMTAPGGRPSSWARELKFGGLGRGPGHMGSTTVTLASSSHGSLVSTMSGAPKEGSPGCLQLPPRGRASRPSGSGSGSQASSPWHLPSPSVNDTASDHLNSSQQSGSDTAWVHREGTSEEHSHSDASGCWNLPSVQASDSDAPSAHTDDGGSGTFAPKDAVTTRRLPSNMTGMLSPGSTGSAPGSVGSFREAVGLNGHGPVVGHEAHRDAISGAAGVAPGLLQFNPRRRGNLRQGHRLRPSSKVVTRARVGDGPPASGSGER